MNPDDITIRTARIGDRDKLERLAALDSRWLREGDHLLAEAGGAPLAAVPVAGGPAMADPFRSTATVVALLELRRDELAAAQGGPPSLKSLGGRLGSLRLRRSSAANC